MNKDYIKPEVEFVNLTAEPITTEELLPDAGPIGGGTSMGPAPGGW